jgi:hypothetical protein
MSYRTTFKYYVLAIISCFLSFNLQANNNNEQQAVVITEQFIKDIQKANVNNLNTILDDKYIHIHGTGLIENKDKFLEALSTKKRIYNTATLSNVSVLSYNDAYIVQGQLAISVSSGAKQIAGTNLISIVIIKENNNWKIIHFQGTKI